MPEGDSIAKLANLLADELVGRRLVEARREGEAIAAFRGREVTDVCAYGKHMFTVVGGLLLRTHLGMRGDWHRYRRGERFAKPAWQASALLQTDTLAYVCFAAKEVELMEVEGVRFRALLARLGPDVLDSAFDPAHAAARARSLPAATPMCDVVLHQGVAAGIGNVYKNEILFAGELHPARPLGTVDDRALVETFARAADWMRANVPPGPRQTRAPRPGGGATLWVYGRLGQPCHLCATPIAYTRMGHLNRSTYWCPRCQPETGLAAR
ncbi:MAG: DNA-formamidopyrimidine glycosylase family protein [Planctomycetota bacterium]